jgi:hemolysin activation/secretion protein
VYPAVWSVSDTFGRVEGEGTAYLTAPLPLRPTLALRAGGAKLFGRYPFHEAATIGGSGSLRGLLRQRYAGDAAAYGNVELRLLLLRRDRSLVPRFGVFGLADAGRVFVEGEASDRWHTAFGGGIWLAIAEPKRIVSVALAQSEGHLRFYVQGGFTF